jgi:hypothetical protein
MAVPGDPIDVPDDALSALEDFRNSFESLLPAEAQYGVGFKAVGGEYLDQVSLIVYVPEKLPEAQIPDNALIPATWDFAGAEFPTDVIQNVPVDIALVNDTQSYQPTNGGVEIGRTEVIDEVTVRIRRGTLGCAVARRSDGEVLALTAAHVAPEGETMNQPAPGELGSRVLGVVGANDAGVTWDCSVITLHDGEPAPIATIQEIGAVAGSTAFQLWGSANKRGRTTGLTAGTVVSFIPDPRDQGMERIVVDTVPFGGQYCQPGDSGSAVVDGNGNVIGLLVQMGTDTPIGYAIPIARVLDALDVEVST